MTFIPCCRVFALLAKAEKVDYFPAQRTWGLIWKYSDQILTVVPITYCPFCSKQLHLPEEKAVLPPAPIPPAPS